MLKRKLKICKTESNNAYDTLNDLIGIYLWVNKTTNRIYIGSSVSLSNRIRSHILGSSNKSLRKDINKYGITNFTMSILEFIEFKEDIQELKKYVLEREQYYLDTLCKASDLNNDFYKISYNKNRKADSPLGYKHSEESKKKMSIAHTNKVLSESHKQNIRLNHISKQPGFISATKLNGMSEKQRDVIKNMIQNNKKSILQYDNKGYFIKEWSSIIEASKELNIDSGNLSVALSKSHRTIKSFYFRYKIENYPIILNLRNIIQVYDINLNFIDEFISAIDIQRNLNVSRTTVTKALKNNKGISKNYIFKYRYENM